MRVAPARDATRAVPRSRRHDLDPRLFAATLTAGVLLVHGLPSLPPLWFSCACALPALLPWRLRLPWSGFALGVLLSVWQGGLWLSQRWPEDRQGEEHRVQGRIVSLPSRDGDALHFLFAPDDAALPPLIRAGWYHTVEPILGGECWTLDLRVRTPRGSSNPAGFDYEGWLYRQGIDALATVRDGERCTTQPAGGLLALREAIRTRIDRWLPDHPARGLVAGLTIGDQSEIANADWEVFRLTGTSHLVAVSGFNVAIVAGSIFFALRWLWTLLPALCLRLPAQRAAAVGAAGFACAYAALAGFEAPVARATMMVLLALLAALLTRRASLTRILALAWIGVLLLQPAAVLSPGVWLSFGAVAAIAYAAAGRAGRIAPWREGITVQLMLSLVLAPLSLYFFQGVSWIAPLVNMVAVPIVAVLTPLLVVALLLASLWPAFGVPVLGTSAEIVWKLREGLAWSAQHLPQPWLPSSPPFAALLLALVGALLLFAPRGLPTRWLGCVLMLPLLLPRSSGIDQGARIAVLDVGQGLAVAVQTAHHALVFDAGPAYDEGFDAGRSVVVPYLVSAGMRRLDLLIVSHGDLDHRGGAPAVRGALSPREEYGALSATPCRDGQRWDWDGVAFEILHPPDASWEHNNGGCVLRIVSGNHAVLLPADIEGAAEQRLLHDHAGQLRADLVVVPHHGSRTSSTSAFVAAVHPQVVIFPAGFANSYRHPRAEVVERYQRIGAQLFMTGTEGAVIVDIDPERGIRNVTEWRAVAARFWRAPALPVTGR